MSNDKPTLSKIAQRASDRHDGAKGRAMERVAEKAGFKLTHTTFDRMLAGTYTPKKPSAKTLEALAKLSGTPIDEVRRAAGVPVPLSPFADQLPPDVDLMDGQQREAVIGVVRQFIAARKALLATEGSGARADDAGSAAASKAGAGDLVNNPEREPLEQLPLPVRKIVEDYLRRAGGDEDVARGLLTHDAALEEGSAREAAYFWLGGKPDDGVSGVAAYGDDDDK